MLTLLHTIERLTRALSHVAYGHYYKRHYARYDAVTPYYLSAATAGRVECFSLRASQRLSHVAILCEVSAVRVESKRNAKRLVKLV